MNSGPSGPTECEPRMSTSRRHFLQYSLTAASMLTLGAEALAGPGKKPAASAKDKKKTLKLYTDALSGCYACHKASFKPYLRPQIPTAPEVRVINFDPKAKDPM